MKYYDITTTLFLVGCLCVIVISSSKGESTAASGLAVTTVLLEDNYNTSAFSNPINDSLSSDEDLTLHGIKSKVKNIVSKVKNIGSKVKNIGSKVKNKPKDGQGGNWKVTRHHKLPNESSVGSTVLLAIFGTILALVIILAVFFACKEEQIEKQKKKESESEQTRC